MTFWLSHIDYAIPNYFYFILSATIITYIELHLSEFFVYLPLPNSVLFQQWYIENIMNSLFLKKLQLVNLFLNRIEHPELSKKLCFQLAIIFGLDIFAI